MVMMRSNEEDIGFAPDYTQITMTTYASDVSGAASALYELGGMSVIHDASGCNSTYSTHDEPRWETMDSAVYISALNEMDAVLGNESVLTQSLIDACQSLKPAFTMLAGTIIPMMTGADLKGIARDVEAATGVSTFALSTNGMRDYTVGAAQAWIELARRFVKAPVGQPKRAVNLLGATPLDFSVCGELDAIVKTLENAGVEVNACWAMGAALDDLVRTRNAALNVVLSSSGLPLGQVFARHFGMPFMTTLPFGDGGDWAQTVAMRLDEAMKGKFSALDLDRLLVPDEEKFEEKLSRAKAARILVVHEPLRALRLAEVLERFTGESAMAISALHSLGIESRRLAAQLSEEEFDSISAAVSDRGPRVLVSDPLFFMGAKRSGFAADEACYVSLPHEAASGRIWRKEMPNLFSPEGFDGFLARIQAGLNK